MKAKPESALDHINVPQLVKTLHEIIDAGVPCKWCCGTGVFAKDEKCKFCLGTKSIPYIPPGTLRARDEQGKWMVASPQDPTYSTMSMIATEFWDVENQNWMPIFDKEEGDV